jgi:hypothetical protein
MPVSERVRWTMGSSRGDVRRWRRQVPWSGCSHTHTTAIHYFEGVAIHTHRCFRRGQLAPSLPQLPLWSSTSSHLEWVRLRPNMCRSWRGHRTPRSAAMCSEVEWPSVLPSALFTPPHTLQGAQIWSHPTNVDQRGWCGCQREEGRGEQVPLRVSQDDRTPHLTHRG